MPFIITRDGADPVIVDTKSGIALVPPDVRLYDVLRRVVGEGETLTMAFADGTHGTMARSETATSQQTALMLPPPVDSPRDFEMECKFLFEVDAQVTCTATNKRHATRIVEEIFQGQRPAGTFKVRVNRESLLAMVADLDRPIHTASDFVRLWPADVIINRIEER